MSKELSDLYPYGDDYEKFEDLLEAINLRWQSGITNLRGAAIVWLPQPDNSFRRVGVRVMPDGELNFVHAEYF